MRQRFRARELWLFAPFLLIGVAALYWARIEKVEPQHPPGLSVEKFEINRASPYKVSQGYSHELTITLWDEKPFTFAAGGSVMQASGGDALHPNAPFAFPMSQAERRNTLMGDAVLTTSVAGKPTRQKQESSFMPAFGVDGNRCVVKHYLRIDAVPRKRGAVTFHGAYWLLGRPVFTLKREVRAANAPAPPTVDHDSGFGAVKLVTEPFVVEPCGPGSAAGCTEDKVEVNFIYRRKGDLQNEENGPRFAVDKLEVEDENHRIYRNDASNQLRMGAVGMSQAQEKLKAGLASGENVAGIILRLDSKAKTRGRLKLRGVISVNERWPQPFEVKLPPRAVATAPA